MSPELCGIHKCTVTVMRNGADRRRGATLISIVSPELSIMSPEFVSPEFAGIGGVPGIGVPGIDHSFADLRAEHSLI